MRIAVIAGVILLSAPAAGGRQENFGFKQLRLHGAQVASQVVLAPVLTQHLSIGAYEVSTWHIGTIAESQPVFHVDSVVLPEAVALRLETRGMRTRDVEMTVQDHGDISPSRP